MNHREKERKRLIVTNREIMVLAIVQKYLDSKSIWNGLFSTASGYTQKLILTADFEWLSKLISVYK